MIKIATAECFTHGKIANELHCLAQNYDTAFNGEYTLEIKKFIKENYLKFDLNQISVNCGLFIPTIEAAHNILRIKDLPEPYKLIKGIKVYKDKGDMEASLLMARGVKDISGADIAIGTTAGIGYGGISILTDKLSITSSSDYSADLIKSNGKNLFKRQENGIKKTIKILIYLLNEDIDEMRKFNNINIQKL